MKVPIFIIVLIRGMLLGVVGLFIISSGVFSMIADKLSSAMRRNSKKQIEVAPKVIKRKCPHCASVIELETVQCDTCQQKITPVALANEERDMAFASTEPAQRMTMVHKLAKFKALSDPDIDALLNLSRDGDSADLQSKAQAVLMDYFEITTDNTHYRYQTYRYDRFDYAVAYAKQDMKKQEQKNELSIGSSASR